MEETTEEEFSASTTNIWKSVIIKRSHQLLSKKQHRLFSTSSKECSTGDNIIKTEESDP